MEAASDRVLPVRKMEGYERDNFHVHNFTGDEASKNTDKDEVATFSQYTK
jgi:hypothetical protein